MESGSRDADDAVSHKGMLEHSNFVLWLRGRMDFFEIKMIGMELYPKCWASEIARQAEKRTSLKKRPWIKISSEVRKNVLISI